MRALNNQSADIKEEIFCCLHNKMTTKEEIVTAVVDKLDVPRPTVRRAKNELLTTLKNYVKILEGESKS